MNPGTWWHREGWWIDARAYFDVFFCVFDMWLVGTREEPNGYVSYTDESEHLGLPCQNLSVCVLSSVCVVA